MCSDRGSIGLELSRGGGHMGVLLSKETKKSYDGSGILCQDGTEVHFQ